MHRDNVKDNPNRLTEEVIIVNALAMVLVALGIVLSYTVNRHSLRVNKGSIITERL